MQESVVCRLSILQYRAKFAVQHITIQLALYSQCWSVLAVLNCTRSVELYSHCCSAMTWNNYIGIPPLSFVYLIPVERNWSQLHMNRFGWTTSWHNLPPILLEFAVQGIFLPVQSSSKFCCPSPEYYVVRFSNWISSGSENLTTYFVTGSRPNC